MTFKLVLDLFLLLTVLSLIAIVLMGWGNLTLRWLSVEQPSRPSVLTVWLGFCIVVVVLEFIHLFIPINWKVTCGIAIIGFVGQRLKSKTALRSSRESVGLITMSLSVICRYPLRTLVGAIVIVAWCLRAMETPTMYDSGLYHFGSIRWLNEYPIIPGLGNLHWRLALNQSYFGFLAVLNVSPFWGKGYATGGLFLLILTAFTLLEIGLKQSSRWRWIFGGILFSYLCLLSGPLANPLPDTAVALLQIAIFIFLYCYVLARTDGEADDRHQVKRLQITLLCMCMTIVTIKLSSVAFALTSFTLVIFWMLRSPQLTFSNSLLIKSAFFFGFAVFLHLARSYLLSGAPFFPSPVAGVWSLPWAVQFGVAHNESQLIYAWAKQPGVESVSQLADGYAWVGPWLAALPSKLKYLFLASTSFTIMAILLRCRSGRSSDWAQLLLGIPLAAAYSFWFFTAPDPRFLGAIAILFFVWSAYIFCEQIYAVGTSSLPSGGTVVSFVLNAFVIMCATTLFVRWSLNGVAVPNGWDKLPTPEVSVKSSELGIEALVPTKDSQCWNAELPCAVLLHGGLMKLPMFGFLRPFGVQSERFGFGLVR